MTDNHPREARALNQENAELGGGRLNIERLRLFPITCFLVNMGCISATSTMMSNLICILKATLGPGAVDFVFASLHADAEQLTSRKGRVVQPVDSYVNIHPDTTATPAAGGVAAVSTKFSCHKMKFQIMNMVGLTGFLQLCVSPLMLLIQNCNLKTFAMTRSLLVANSGDGCETEPLLVTDHGENSTYRERPEESRKQERNHRYLVFI